MQDRFRDSGGQNNPREDLYRGGGDGSVGIVGGGWVSYAMHLRSCRGEVEGEDCWDRRECEVCGRMQSATNLARPQVLLSLGLGPRRGT